MSVDQAIRHRGLGFLAFLVVISAGAFLAARANRGGPMAVIDRTSVRTPVVLRGESIRGTFNITNEGDAPLLITDIRNACIGEASISTRNIAPGERAQLTIAFDSRNLPEGDVQDLSTELSTNDQHNRQIWLTLNATVRSEFIVSEPIIDFGTSSQSSGSAAERTIVVTRSPSVPAHVLSVRTSDSAVVVSLARTPAADIVRVIQREIPSRDSQFGNVILTTSSSLTPELRIPIKRSRP